MPAIISVGVVAFATAAAFHPHVVVLGARRTPGPQVAPTGSDFIISDQRTSRMPGSTWSAQPVWRCHNASSSARDCVSNAAPSAGTFAGEVEALPRV